MNQRFFIFDATRCFGCNGCVAACANINQTGADQLWRTVHKLPPEDGRSDTVYLSVSCNHCELAPCARACPTGAMEKRVEDGVVIHHKEKCIGCRYCQMACPYDAIKWNAAAGVVSKCHFCHEGLDQGRQPACIETCFVSALQMIVIDNDDQSMNSYSSESPGLIAHPYARPSIRFINGQAENPAELRTLLPVSLPEEKLDER